MIAAALTACNPFLIWYSQEARSYSMLVLLTSVALLALAYARATPTPRTLAAWVVASGLALATHYYALLAIVPQAIWLLGSEWRRRSVRIAVGIVGICGLALIPLAVSQNGTGNASWIAKIALGPRLGQIIPQFVIGTGSRAYAVLEPLGATMVVVGLLLLALRSDRIERRSALAVGALAVGGLILNLALVAVGVDDLITRNVIVLWLPAAICVAGGLGARRAGLIGICAAVVLCATGVAAAISVASDRNLQRPDWRGVARVLGTQPAAGSAATGDPDRALPGPATAISVPAASELLAKPSPTDRPRARCRVDQRTTRRPLLVGRRLQPDPVPDAELLPDPGLSRGLAAPGVPVHDHAPGRRQADRADAGRRIARPHNDDAAPRRAVAPALGAASRSTSSAPSSR